jgi:uncharacterized C2H2 Zn-finger protein
MVQYNCNPCSFKTNNKTDNNRHYKTAKHIQNVKEHTILNNKNKIDSRRLCKLCDKLFATKSNLTTHLNRFHSEVNMKKNCDSIENVDEHKNKKSVTLELSEDFIASKTRLADSYPNVSPMLADKNDKLSCKYCENKFKHKSSKSRHENKCAQQLLNKHKIELLEVKIDMQKKIIEAHETTGKIANKSLSLLGYLMTEYNDNPPLQSICHDEIKAIINKKNDLTTHSITQRLISEYNHDNLANFIGQGIVELYKKDDINDQSIHTSDVSRHNYIIMLADGTDKKWKKDIQGGIINDKIITPILTNICKTIVKFQETIKRYDSETEFDHKEAATSNDILDSISDGKLHRTIHKIIAPYFKTIPLIEEVR